MTSWENLSATKTKRAVLINVQISRKTGNLQKRNTNYQ